MVLLCLHFPDFINALCCCNVFFKSIENPFGKGVYFARDASYALRETYSPKDANGLRYVYYARVLVGDYANGNSTMLVPPSKNTADPNETYDSVVNDTKDPSIFVMFKDYQYYTEYLITFK